MQRLAKPSSLTRRAGSNPAPSAALDLPACPHCQTTLTEPVHVCPDTKAWTNAERDVWRDYLRAKYPGVQMRKVDQTVSKGR